MSTTTAEWNAVRTTRHSCAHNSASRVATVQAENSKHEHTATAPVLETQRTPCRAPATRPTEPQPTTANSRSSYDTSNSPDSCSSIVLRTYAGGACVVPPAFVGDALLVARGGGGRPPTPLLPQPAPRAWADGGDCTTVVRPLSPVAPGRTAGSARGGGGGRTGNGAAAADDGPEPSLADRPYVRLIFMSAVPQRRSTAVKELTVRAGGAFHPPAAVSICCSLLREEPLQVGS